jgi:hypothetical protein
VSYVFNPGEAVTVRHYDCTGFVAAVFDKKMHVLFTDGRSGTVPREWVAPLVRPGILWECYCERLEEVQP